MTQPPPGASYPTSSDEVSADRLARHLTAVAAHHDAAAHPLLMADPKSTEGALYRALTSAYVSEFAVVYLLRHVAQRDSALADELAHAVWECWNSGQVMHELVWQWAHEYGHHDKPAESGAAAS